MDWTGNASSCFVTLGARNIAKQERAENDYYATEPKAVELLLQVERFNKEVLEPACGEGHISEVLKKAGYSVYSYDLVDRGYGDKMDFFNLEEWTGDIITNPPYKYAKEFVQHALEIILDGSKVAMFLKVQFLESRSRRELFEKNPPKCIYVSSGRLCCARNGDFEAAKGSNAMCYCWYVWEKGFKGDTILKWIN